jgi:hypothetical protein
MHLTAHTRGPASRPATGLAAAGGISASRLRRLSARVLLFSLLAVVLIFGAPIMRSASIFEEDRSETKHRVEAAPLRLVCETDHRHRLPDYMPWADGSSLAPSFLYVVTGETAVHGYYQTGPPPSRAPPGRLV